MYMYIDPWSRAVRGRQEKKEEFKCSFRQKRNVMALTLVLFVDVIFIQIDNTLLLLTFKRKLSLCVVSDVTLLELVSVYINQAYLMQLKMSLCLE